MNDTPLDDVPSYNDLSQHESYLILAFRRLLEDHKMIDMQATEGMLDYSGAANMSVLSMQQFYGLVQRYLVASIKDGRSNLSEG